MVSCVDVFYGGHSVGIAGILLWWWLCCVEWVDDVVYIEDIPEIALSPDDFISITTTVDTVDSLQPPLFLPLPLDAPALRLHTASQ